MEKNTKLKLYSLNVYGQYAIDGSCWDEGIVSRDYLIKESDKVYDYDIHANRDDRVPYGWEKGECKLQDVVESNGFRTGKLKVFAASFEDAEKSMKEYIDDFNHYCIRDGIYTYDVDF